MGAIYDVEVTTGSMTHAGTFDNIFITLIGTQGVSERAKLDSYGRDFKTGMKVTYKVITRFTLANLLLIRLEKDNFMFLPENDWFCSLVNVRTPEKDVIHFPCYRWMAEGEVIELREAKATQIYEEKYSHLKEHRKNELKLNKQVYQWTEFKTGLPQHAFFQEPLSLPSVVRFSFTKDMDSAFNCSTALGEIKMKKLVKKPDQWVQMEDMKSAFWSSRTAVSEYVQLHWMDDFFGYQLLNGSNPMMLRRCTELPLNFAVTNGMVQPFLESGTSLTLEMKQGNIFLCDYKRLADLPTQFINGKQQYVAAPLCLLYKNQVGKLLPIAIQLQQQASEDNPVFLPSDSEYDWQLAKLYVRNADCLEHQASFYLRTHLAETFTVSLMRNLPAAHPIHKLLVPHTRYTLQINTLIQNRLLGPVGAVTQNTSIGDEGMTNLIKKALSDLTHSSLCLPEDISDRGLESIPNFFYRDDGLRLWSFINYFVRSMVEFYYQSDSDVQQDTELQDWIKEIFIHGFLEQSSTGIPQCFSTVEEVIKCVTMVIFTVSAQHSALRAGQFDYGSWFPNAPGSLKQPPPTSKGSSDKNTLLDTLPDMNTSAYLVSVFWLLSKPSSDLVPLGQYLEDYFCQMASQKRIRDFQAELSFFSESINDRNKGLQVPYTYMCPDNISNSVSI
ncbi:hydroperoxide isomerase ALOXE3 isoform X1 [Sinocyclocheilus anshuiensis]|uniref:hydroperoxide isomerase ALOXE3 isoform X1 n=2 Tax=Sinocyclocheilus anshuiensis TaxID=1608454 RepID=UPI0007B87F7C|nr:PREDICTED: hydroperoxide isomerase ALOXE3-like isoform X1 [Sinocyclocheilus anshuiensis]XP_016356949.1 PREDICTED: hydroperoxide isomerase ALOXE3-like isoform X1 [Sinocyclocheilus anshuiensis]